MEAWKTEKSEQVLDTPWVRVRKDTVSLPNGKRMDDFYAVTIRDAAAKFRVKDDVAQGHAADWYLKGAASYYIAGQTNQLCAA